MTSESRRAPTQGPASLEVPESSQDQEDREHLDTLAARAQEDRGGKADTRASGRVSDNGGDEQSTALFDEKATETYQGRWQEIQARFVDDPRSATREADGLVSEVVDQLVRSFGAERTRLEKAWDHGEDVSTEDLRVALRRYRSFFGRLLAI